jgi:hypothetical protein
MASIADELNTSREDWSNNTAMWSTNPWPNPDPVAFFPTTNATWTGAGSQPNVCRTGLAATNRLRRGTTADRYSTAYILILRLFASCLSPPCGVSYVVFLGGSFQYQSHYYQLCIVTCSNIKNAILWGMSWWNLANNDVSGPPPYIGSLAVSMLLS